MTDVHAVVLADGEPPTRAALDAAWPGWAEGVTLVVAADGGTRSAAPLGLRLDLIVGDLDSIDPIALERLAADGVPIERAPADKDETDTELAVLAAIGRGATRLTIVGGLGGPRLDHELANVALLALPALGDRPARLLDGNVRISLVTAPGPDGRAVRADLEGPIGALVSLIPWGGDVTGVTTSGLRYPLIEEALPAGPARGISNLRTTVGASVEVGSGRLLVIESAATLRP
jgi:thiamine pyrophosphokinase